MTIDEAMEKYDAMNRACISILVESDDGMVAMSAINLLGGVCDCCRHLDVDDNTVVARVVDVETMEVLYERA